nr:hypothetical protein [Brevundimonas aveniformis]
MSAPVFLAEPQLVGEPLRRSLPFTGVAMVERMSVGPKARFVCEGLQLQPLFKMRPPDPSFVDRPCPERIETETEGPVPLDVALRAPAG